MTIKLTAKCIEVGYRSETQGTATLELWDGDEPRGGAHLTGLPLKTTRQMWDREFTVEIKMLEELAEPEEAKP